SNRRRHAALRELSFRRAALSERISAIRRRRRHHRRTRSGESRIRQTGKRERCRPVARDRRPSRLRRPVSPRGHRGGRLRARGWKLARIDVPAIDHYGHTGNAYALLLRRWRTRLAFGTGEVLRATIGRNTFWPALRKMRHELVLLVGVHVWWLALIAVAFATATSARGALALAALALLPFAVMALKCRSLCIGLYSVTAWNVYAAGIWPGLFGRRADPSAWIDSTIVQKGHAVDAVQAPRLGGCLNNLVTGSGADGASPGALPGALPGASHRDAPVEPATPS